MNKEKKNTPKIRFKGFYDDWEQRKLGELAESFEYGLNASAKKFDGSNKYIRITDIDDISHKFNQSGVTTPDIDFANANNYKLKKGDILFARTGASVGKTYMYRESDGLVYYAGFLIRARIKSKISSEFVFQTTFTDSYNQFIKITSQRSGQPGVNAEEYSNFKIMIPNYEEQNAIGCFLKKVDDTIALHQRKLEQLRRLKQWFLQVLFANEANVPRVRFAGFTEEWEQRKFKELSKKTGNKNSKGLDFPAYSVSNKFGLIAQTEQFDGSRLDDLEKTSYKFVEPNDFAYNPARINVGSIAFNNLGKTVLVSSLYVVVKMSETLNNEFALQYIKSPLFIREVKRNTEGSVREYLFYENFSNIKIPYTKYIEEQELIGRFFKLLDNTISLHQNKLSQLKKLKKSFLQKMFI